jgi:hypothetical protein
VARAGIKGSWAGIQRHPGWAGVLTLRLGRSPVPTPRQASSPGWAGAFLSLAGPSRHPASRPSSPRDLPRLGLGPSRLPPRVGLGPGRLSPRAGLALAPPAGLPSSRLCPGWAELGESGLAGISPPCLLCQTGWARL